VLEVAGLSAWYGEAQVLREVNLSVANAEVVTLVGRNGAGKTTLLRSLIGLHAAVSGQVRLDGQDIGRMRAHERARLGLGYVPDDRGVYATLSVEENLLLPPRVGPSAWSLDRVYDTFPRLKERRTSPGSRLSGGEQQMLSIARVLRMGARLLLLDEPTEGLAPVLVQHIATLLRDLKSQGVTILLIEQNLRFAMGVAEHHYLLAQGAIVDVFSNEQLEQREGELLAHLGV